jgi:hypothetical protein
MNNEINLDFSKKINNLYANIDCIKMHYKKIAVYGYGIVGKIISNLLENSLEIIADENCDIKDKKICHPKDLKHYDFDFVLISVLGREEIITDNLIKKYHIDKNKILSVDLIGNLRTSLPILSIEKNKLISLKNKFANKRCFIIGNGPSLNKCDLNLLKDEYTFGVNGIFYKTEQMGFRPTFYMVEDNHVIADNRDKINSYNCEYKFFPSIYRNDIKEKDNTYFFNTDFGFYEGNHSFFCKPRFSKDFSNCAYAGQSVTYLQIQLAYFLGFSEIYLIGMDYDYIVPKSTVINGYTYESNEDDPNHFHPDYFGKGKKWHDPKIERVGLNYRKAKEIFENNGRIIRNATIGGKLDIFKRVNYNELFK